MDNFKKIIIFTVPFAGHTNPILAFCKELQANKNVKLIVYSQSQFKGLIEGVGAEYRTYNFEIKIETKENKNFEINMMKDIFDHTFLADKMIKHLYQEVLNERPHLIIYDNYAYFIKIPLKYILKEFKKQNIKAPKFISYDTTFHFTTDYPNSYELSLLNMYSKQDFFTSMFYILILFLKRLILIFKYGFDLSFLSDFFSSHILPVDNELNLVFTFSQLQPRSHLLKPNVKFIGSSFDTVMHFQGDSTEENKLVEHILNDFHENKTHENVKKQKHLIYASLGTVFIREKEIYFKLIQGFKEFINENKHLDVKIIFSIGQYVYDSLKNVEIPNEILIVKFAPQIEILKRASLCITHSGMNTTSEAVHYGVPMICLPNAADQPWVAYRISDELGLGIRLHTPTVSPNQIKDAITKVINDTSFRKRALVYQNLSNSLNGSKNFAEEVINILKNE